jgi:hypothetical protein
LPNRGPWHAIVINDIREDLVLAWENCRQVFQKRPAFDTLGDEDGTCDPYSGAGSGRDASSVHGQK